MDDRRRTTDDGRRASSDGKNSRCLWQGELTTIIGQICRSTRTHYSDSEPTSLCSFSLMLRSQRRSNKYQFYIVLFNKIAARTHNLSHSKRARQPLRYRCGSLFLLNFYLFFLIKISYCPSIYFLKTKINPKQ